MPQQKYHGQTDHQIRIIRISTRQAINTPSYATQLWRFHSGSSFVSRSPLIRSFSVSVGRPVMLFLMYLFAIFYLTGLYQAAMRSFKSRLLMFI